MKNLLVLFFSLLSIVSYSQCTNLANNMVINTPRTACSGTWDGVDILSDLEVPTGKTVVLTNAVIGNVGSITVQTGGKLTIGGFGFLFNTPIRVFGTGQLIINSDVIVSSTLTLGNSGKLTINGKFLIDDVTNIGTNCTVSISDTALIHGGWWQGTGTVFTAANLHLTGGCSGCYSIAGKVTIAGRTFLDVGTSGLTINACKFTTGTLTNNATNAVDGTGYIYVNTLFNGTGGALTPVSTIKFYNAGSSSGTGANPGSATVGLITPSPC